MMTADEMIEVIQAWKNGKEIEFLWHNHEDYEDWELTTDPEWNFPEVDYRVKPAAIAAGRNPEGLTVEQIKGYRCLSYEEFDGLEAVAKYGDIYYLSSKKTPYNCSGEYVFGKCSDTTYFTDKPEGYFLPKQEPEKPYWSKPEDVPLDVDWMRHKERKVRVRIGAVYAHGVACFGIGEIRFEEIKDYETWDGSEWQECRCK